VTFSSFSARWSFIAVIERILNGLSNIQAHMLWQLEVVFVIFIDEVLEAIGSVIVRVAALD
jgi:hypothetical protein